MSKIQFIIVLIASILAAFSGAYFAIHTVDAIAQEPSDYISAKGFVIMDENNEPAGMFAYDADKGPFIRLKFKDYGEITLSVGSDGPFFGLTEPSGNKLVMGIRGNDPVIGFRHENNYLNLSSAIFDMGFLPDKNRIWIGLAENMACLTLRDQNGRVGFTKVEK